MSIILSVLWYVKCQYRNSIVSAACFCQQKLQNVNFAWRNNSRVFCQKQLSRAGASDFDFEWSFCVPGSKYRKNVPGIYVPKTDVDFSVVKLKSAITDPSLIIAVHLGRMLPKNVLSRFNYTCMRSVVTETCIKGRANWLHSADTVGCNELSLPLILDSGTTPLSAYQTYFGNVWCHQTVRYMTVIKDFLFPFLGNYARLDSITWLDHMTWHEFIMFAQFR